MKPIVFLGPSLPLGAARKVLDAEFLPPVAQGDVLRLIGCGASIVVIIDGAFESAPAVWHNEILFAIERGLTVIGAASMGALRAAELARYGMIGVGAIYHAYRRGWLEGDDEVAVLHAPNELGGAALTEALVNVRWTCRSAVRAGILSPDEAARLVQFAKGVHYKARTWARILQECDNCPLTEDVAGTLAAWVKGNRVDQKARDAAAALSRARMLQSKGPRARHGERIPVEPTAAWLTLLAETGAQDHAAEAICV